MKIKHILLFFALLFCTARGLSASSPRAAQESFVAVAEKAMPAVVTVYSDDGVGSGFIFDENGFIVTNDHVIGATGTPIVQLADGRKFAALIVGVSPAADIAVLKIKAPDPLPYLKFADTDRVKVGHYAIAIGSPFSLSQTMTVGIVSHKGRKLGLNCRENYIQTDAAINPGNSGGPLLDLDGEVIGVNDCIIAPSNSNGERGSAGLGFAIDGNLAKMVVLAILRSTFPEKPYLGIVLSDAGVNSPAVIKEVVKSSPAEKAGLRVGDRIIQIGKHPVSTAKDAQMIVLAFCDPGKKASIAVIRNGGRIEKSILVDAVQR